MTDNTVPKCRPLIDIAGGRGRTTVAYMISNILGAHRTLVLHMDESNGFGLITKLWQKWPEDAVLVTISMDPYHTHEFKLGKVWGILDTNERLSVAGKVVEFNNSICDVVLHNDGTLAELEAKVRAALAAEGFIK